MSNADWEYRCTGCGHVVLAGADFNKPCPSCGGHGWICHWLKKDQPRDKSQGNMATGQGITPPREVSPLNRASAKGDKPILPGARGAKKTGSNRREMPDDLIKELANQGLGCKAISARLLDRGMVVSYRTIQRRLQGDLL